MFSIFKKKDQDSDKPSASQDVPAATSAELELPAASPSVTSDSGIEVAQLGASLDPIEEEVVVLYANGHADAAVATLEAVLPELKGKRRLESWLLLFELYQQQGARAQFDELALQYVVEFEVTPPLWRELATVAPSHAQASGGLMVLPAQFDLSVAPSEADKLMRLIDVGRPVRLDVGRVSQIDAIAAGELLMALGKAFKAKVPVQLLGGAALVALLKSLIEPGRRVPAEAPFWLLLLDVLQCMGAQEEFDNLAVVYAVTYEMSPPSWDDALVSGVSSASVDTHDAAPVPPSAVRGLPLAGDLVNGAAASIGQIQAYLDAHSRAELDFSGVRRVDFETASLLLNQFMSALTQGRAVVILHANELVACLFQLLGISELVEVNPEARA
ncbi:STAS domain-containing protein [Chitinibacteraceae bacterium HSL-7]